jgi:hypothetical protein
LTFAYDWQGRRVSKQVSAWNGAAWVAQSTNRFAYDGWNLLAVLGPDSVSVLTFCWGLGRIGVVIRARISALVS